MGRTGTLQRLTTRGLLALAVVTTALAMAAPSASAAQKVIWASTDTFDQSKSSCMTRGCTQYDYFAKDYGTSYRGWARMALAPDGAKRPAYRWAAGQERWVRDDFGARDAVVWVQTYAAGWYWAWTKAAGWRVVRSAHVIVARRVVTP